MVLPWVRIVWISDIKGYGLVADRPIPKGTITFVQDGLDIVIPSENLDHFDPRLLAAVEKYSYEDFLGNRVISWDLAKYMNHDDRANTLTTGYGFEIAIRDIEPGEEVTDDYRIFSTHHNTSFTEPQGPLNDLKPWPDELLNQWDNQVRSALQSVTGVEQPLFDLVDRSTWDLVTKLTRSPKLYRSVSEALPLRYKRLTTALST